MATPRLNVLGFSCCGVQTCDCGARIVLGITHQTMKRFKEVLEREGFIFEHVGFKESTETGAREGNRGAKAESEPMHQGAWRQFIEYTNSPVTRDRGD